MGVKNTKLMGGLQNEVKQVRNLTRKFNKSIQQMKTIVKMIMIKVALPVTKQIMTQRRDQKNIFTKTLLLLNILNYLTYVSPALVWLKPLRSLTPDGNSALPFSRVCLITLQSKWRTAP